MPIHPYLSQRPLFKAYDIRGDRSLFTQDFSEALSHAFCQQFIAERTLTVEGNLETKYGFETNYGFETAQELKSGSEPTIVIGHDMRHGSLALAEQFAKTLIGYGMTVVWLGLVTTPVMVYWAHQYEGHGVIATASHSAKHIIGIKWIIEGESPSSERIQELYARLHHLAVLPPPLPATAAQLLEALPAQTARSANRSVKQLPAKQVRDGYVNAVHDAITGLNPTSAANSQTESTPSLHHSSLLATQPRPFKIVIDCLNGATGLFAKRFFELHPSLCQEIIVLNDTPDGSFPKGNPDPTEGSRLQELSAAVMAYQADIGLGFDGDGDRLMVVDDTGKVLAPDYLIYLLACVAMHGASVTKSTDTALRNSLPHGSINNGSVNNDATIIFDVKCSHHLPRLLKQMNATPQMSKTGSSIMRRALQTSTSNAIFAGELSGHFLFNDGHFILHDDAMYAALRLLHWLYHHKQPQPLSQIVASLPQMVSTDDIYLPLSAYSVHDDGEATLLNKLTSLRQQLRIYCETQSTHLSTSQTKASLHSSQQSPTPSLGSSTPKTANTPSLTAMPANQPINQFGLPDDLSLTCIDGIRLDFRHGFGVIRPSNTSNSLTVRFAGDTMADILQIKRYFVNLCQCIDARLAKQIASIAVG